MRFHIRVFMHLCVYRLVDVFIHVLFPALSGQREDNNK